MGFWSNLFGKGTADVTLSHNPSHLLPYEVEAVAGEEVLERLETLRAEGQVQGCTAVLLGDAEDVKRLAENRAYQEAQPEAIIDQAAAVDVPAWLAERAAEEPDYYAAETGRWPTTPSPHESVTAHLDVLTQRPKHTVYLAHIPTPHSWAVPAYLGLGGWNECPDPVQQVAIARYWHERYGAELVAATADVLEFLVARPPVDRDAAEHLAHEQFIYCPDIVHQGTQTVRHLAALLLEGGVWFFWWD